jgi:NitT/TauT family transport system permease protein
MEQHSEVLETSILDFELDLKDKVSRRRAFVLRTGSIILFLAFWYILSVIIDKPRILPSPFLVAEKLFSLILGRSVFGLSYVHLGVTLYRLFVGFIIGFIVGSLLGILMGRLPRIYDLFENVAWIFICVPAVIWSFILLLIFGASNITAMGVSIALIMPKVMLNVAEGTKSFPDELLEMAHSYNASRVMKVRDMYIPYLLPYFFSSARIGLSTGLQIVIVAELVGINSGIGYMIDYWWREFWLAPIIAWGLFLVITGVIIEFGVFRTLEKRSKQWNV